MDSITMYNMNFKDEIGAAYDELGLIPINGQDVAVDRILTIKIVFKFIRLTSIRNSLARYI